MNMIEKVARALCTRHYAARFDKPADDEHVQMNVNAGWRIFKEDAAAAIEAMRGADLYTQESIESMGVVALSPAALRAVARTFSALADDLALVPSPPLGEE